MGTYASISDVQSYTQFTASSTTEPSEQEIEEWITQAEAEIEENRLGEHTATNIYLDVPSEQSNKGIYSTEWSNNYDTLHTGVGKNVVHIPLPNIIRPLIEITKLEKNDEAYSDTPDWTELTEGPADDSSFLLLQTGDKQHGYGLLFYDNHPYEGPKRIRLSYKYGYNIKRGVLREWVARTVAVKTLEALTGTNSPTGLRILDMGGDVPFVYNTNYKDRIEKNMTRLKEIEDKYFPASPDESGYVVF